MKLTERTITAYVHSLEENERAKSTITKYRRDLERFLAFLPQDKILSKERVLQWKAKLINGGFASSSVNVMIASVNGILAFAGRPEWRVKPLKVQRAAFREESRELGRAEYIKLVEAALRDKKERLALVMETICSTGIRVSELRYVTAEAVRTGKAEIMLKGKCRRVLFPAALRKKLAHYIKGRDITRGCVFLNRRGDPLGRHRIWTEMKKISAKAGVAATKVIPHNLRHLFARTFYKLNHDLAKLADILGHSNIETTRIYIATAGAEHLRQLDRMRLIM